VIVIKHGDMLISPQFDRTPWFSWFSSTATALAFIQFTKADVISAAELVDDGWSPQIIAQHGIYAQAARDHFAQPELPGGAIRLRFHPKLPKSGSRYR